MEMNTNEVIRFDSLQQAEIEIGKEKGLAISEYADPKFDWLQMREIRFGLECHVDVKKYANPDFDVITMREICSAERIKINLMKYVKKGYRGITLREINLAIQEGISLDWYLKKGYDGHQLHEIRLAMLGRLGMIRQYILPQMRAAQIAQIRKGLETGVDIHAYADEGYSWQQMQEIRLGLERHMDVSKFMNRFFSWQQMREIRLGILDGINVTDYAKLQYSLQDMKSRRELLLRQYKQEVQEEGLELFQQNEFSNLFLSKDRMRAYLELKVMREDDAYNTDDVIKFINDSGIIKGICVSHIQTAVRDHIYYERVPAAIGKNATVGRDGHYEYQFDESGRLNIEMKSDGTADFSSAFRLERVKTNQRVAIYHAAEPGEDGYNVFGEVICGRRGTELQVLKCQGVRVSEDGAHYFASFSGRIELIENTLHVYHILTIDGDYKRGMDPIDFDGDVLIKGSVRSGVTIKASHHIIVEGNVEPSLLEAGGDVYIRVGMAGQGSGKITAKGSIFANWFENCEIYAQKDVYANFMLQCNVDVRGKVSVLSSKGTIIGGNIYAFNGIIANIIGNTSLVRTRLMVGMNDAMLDEVVLVRIEYSRLNAAIEEMNGKLQKLEGSLVHDEVRNVYIKMKQAMEIDMEELTRLQERLDWANELVEQDKRAKIVIKRTIYPGTVIQIGEGSLAIEDPLNNLMIKKVGNVIKCLFGVE